MSHNPLWRHQQEAINDAVLQCNYALFFEMGCGKTRSVIEIIKHLFERNERPQRTLIFCPPIIIPNWKEEWRSYSEVPPKLVQPLYGSGVKRQRDFEKLSAQGAAIFITNYEALLMPSLLQSFKDWRPEIVVFDESHKLKSHQSKRSKFAYELANPFDKKTKTAGLKPHTYLLSGTPTLNSPLDIFQQYKVLDGGQSLGTNYFAFRAKYFRDRNASMPKDKHFPDWQVMTMERDGVDSLSELNKIIYSKGMRVTKGECLDLPPEVSVVIKVGMSREQSRLYAEMKKDFLTYFNDKACVATLAITKALRLMQITSGYVSAWTPGLDEGPIEHQLGDTPKRAALKALLEEIREQDQQVLVWCVFRHNYQTVREVCSELDIKFVEVHGDVSDKKKREAVDAFKADKTIRVLIGHPGSGGIGINLTCAGFSIFYSRNFSLEHYLQARARNHRGGSREAGHDKITHYDLVCENTIDELALKKLANKESMSEALLADLAKNV